MNEAQARVFVRQIIEVIKTGTTLTSITIDDQIAEMALKAVDNDLLWAWIYKLIEKFLSSDDPIIVGAEDDCPLLQADAAAINPLTIIAIVKAIVDLWKMFRKE